MHKLTLLLKWWYLSPRREHAGIATWTTSKISSVGLFVMCHTYIRTFTHVWHLCAFKSHKVWWRTASHSDIEKATWARLHPQVLHLFVTRICQCVWVGSFSCSSFFAPFHWQLIYICSAKPKPKTLWNVRITTANSLSLPPILCQTHTYTRWHFLNIKAHRHTRCIDSHLELKFETVFAIFPNYVKYKTGGANCKLNSVDLGVQ